MFDEQSKVSTYTQAAGKWQRGGVEIEAWPICISMYPHTLNEDKGVELN